MTAIARGSTVDLRARLRELVHLETGIKLPAEKDEMVEYRLRRRMLDLGIDVFDDYLHWIFEEGHIECEWPEIIDLLTTNKTDFFRENAHFDFLRDVVIPEALERGQGLNQVQFRLWSAASSIGAEAWTAAMILAETARSDARLKWSILGTDISQRVVDVAKRGIYDDAFLSPVPHDFRARYLMSGRDPANRVSRIIPELRAHVRFGSLNLAEPPYPLQCNLDVVFLRNVLIYFEPEQQQRVIAATSSHLKVGGYFIVGHSESMAVDQIDLAQVTPGVFRKTRST